MNHMNQYLDALNGPGLSVWPAMAASLGWAVAVGAVVFLYLRLVQR